MEDKKLKDLEAKYKKLKIEFDDLKKDMEKVLEKLEIPSTKSLKQIENKGPLPPPFSTPRRRQ